MAENKNNMIEKILQHSFGDSPPPEIPEQWRSELREKINETELEEILFVKYEERFWRMAWISFAASIFIFVSIMYFHNKNKSSLKQTVSKQIYEYLTIGNDYNYEDKETL